MRKLEWLLLAILAIAGLGYVASRANQFDPVAVHGPVRSVAFYESVARASAAQFGASVSGWPVTSTTNRGNIMRLVWQRDLVDRGWRLHSPYSVLVTFNGPENQVCRVSVDASGAPVGFYRGPRDPDAASTSTGQQASPETVERARAIALEAFRSKWRSASGLLPEDMRFQLTADGVVEGRDIRFEWTSNADPAGMLAWKIETSVQDGAIGRFALFPLPLEKLREREQEFERTVAPAIFVLIALGVAGLVWALVLTILNLSRKRLPWGFAVRAAAAVGTAMLLDLLLGSELNEQAPDWYLNPQLALTLLTVAALNVGIATVLICAGRSTRAASDFRRWLGVEDFLRLDWAKASVARAFWTSGLVAAFWVAMPYVVSAPFQNLLFDSPTRRALGLSIPMADTLASVGSIAVLFAIAFAFPLLKAYVKWRALRGFLAVAVGAAAASVEMTIDLPWQAALVSSLANGLLMVYTYTRFGVLASVLGGILSVPLARALFLTVNGDVTMQTWGIASLAGASLVVSIAAVLDLRNPAREQEQMLSDEEMVEFQTESERSLVTQRDQMLGEFALAQQAQQRMLPSHPPYVEGFDISAICKPAQQVGGDLYDYIHLHDGRWACCVADVSGKGVSAALYMTMTKGLLNALRLERADLMEIATALNQRLYEVIRRRSFVTMSLAAIDPATRSIEVLRAGHLPMLHVGLSGEATFVESKGMGLALAPSQVFCRNLSAATVKMQPGEVAVLYSDGVTEAMNGKREEFGEDRFAQVVANERSRTAIEIRDQVMDEIQRFQAGAAVHDDITVLVLKASERAENSQ
ncbi:MAG: PP2C family protein-serine/threonine phosphatase [Bryobacterales bacterium]|nr:PP2C family protein-serine/threonine phosphatase [Bryobacterales bacterium]